MKKNKNNRKIAAAVLSLSTAAVLLAGSTFAWFAISNTAEASISGTAVKVENMKVGLVTETALEGFTSGSGNEAGIQWATNYETTAHQATFNTAVETVVKAARGVNNLTITPVTTSTNNGSEAINLFKAPTLTHPANDVPALATDYLTYTIAFKTEEASTPIYLNRAGMAFTTSLDDKTTLNALRIGFDDGATRNIFSPYTIAGSKATKVGGELDLNGDYVYDYTETVSTTTAQTVWYGAGNPTQVDLDGTDGTSVPRDEGTNKDSFTATYLAYQTSDVDYGFTVKKNQIDEADIPTQTAFGMNYLTYDPSVTTVSETTSNHAIATSDSNCIAKINVKIWLEGWDTSCTNDIMEAVFNTTIAFVAPALD